MADAGKKAESYNSRMEDLILALGSKGKQNNSSGREGKKSGTFWIIAWLVAVVLFILFAFVIKNWWFLTTLFGIASLILFVPAIYFGFAPKNIFCTLIEEGTAKIVLKGGEFSHAIIRWEGHKFDGQWNVIQAPAVDYIFGGLCFYGLWPIYTIFSKVFRWQDIQLTQKGERILSHEKKLDYVLVKPAIYGVGLENAETKYPERIPISVQFLITVRVVNPYKVFFSAPQDWNRMLLARLSAFMRGWVSNNLLDDTLFLKGNPKNLWDDLITNNDFGEVISYFLNKWGIKIEDNGIDLWDVSMSDEYQRAGAAEKRMELEAAGVASQTIGMIIASMAKSCGKTTKEIQEIINQDPQLQKQFMKMAQDLLERKMAIDGGSLVDVRVGGAEGFEKTVLQLLAAAKKMGSKNS